MGRQILKKMGLDIFADKQTRYVRSFMRKLERIDDRLIKEYCLTQAVKKLHLGCGCNILKGWLNSDLFPASKDVLHLDVTEPFPLKNNTFEYVFAEHVIEHFSYAQGLQMLKEAFRILKGNGKIRISTPNLSCLMDLYRDDPSELQKHYIKWSIDAYHLEDVPGQQVTFVINNFMRDWGHQFIYDEKLLRTSLEKAGFSAIVKYELRESKDEALRDLENESRMPLGFLRLESITLEGTKVTDSR